MEKIIKKNIFIILLIVSYVTSCKAQHFIKNVPAYVDIGVTSKMVDSLKKENVKVFFLYLTSISKQQIRDSLNVGKDTIIATYFFWQQQGKTHVVLITDSIIYKELILDSDTIFTYPNYTKIWIQEDEDIYQFVCPINIPDNKDIVICISSKSKTFFEMGKNVSYKLNPSRDIYRYEFITLLKKTITSTNNKWIKAVDYNRWIDFTEEK